MPFPVMYQDYKAGRRSDAAAVRLALCATIEGANRAIRKHANGAARSTNSRGEVVSGHVIHYGGLSAGIHARTRELFEIWRGVEISDGEV